MGEGCGGCWWGGQGGGGGRQGVWGGFFFRWGRGGGLGWVRAVGVWGRGGGLGWVVQGVGGSGDWGGGLKFNFYGAEPPITGPYNNRKKLKLWESDLLSG